MSGTEAPRPIERPVTKDTLRLAAEAGYSSEVHRSIRLAASPLSLSEGVELVNTAARVEAEKLEKEAEVLEGLAQQSDDPQWQAVFSPQANELRTRASANRKEADKKEESIQENYTIPYYLGMPRQDLKSK